MDQKNGILMTFIFSSTANLCVSDGKRKARAWRAEKDKNL